MCKSLANIKAMTMYRNVYFCYYKTCLFQIASESSHVRSLFFKRRGHFPSKPGCVSGRTGSVSATAGQEATSPPPTVSAPKNNLKNSISSLFEAQHFGVMGPNAVQVPDHSILAQYQTGFVSASRRKHHRLDFNYFHYFYCPC